LKAESAILVAVSVCIFLSFYFSLLSFISAEESLKRQFVLLAVYSLLSGIIVFGCLIVYIAMKKIFAKTVLSNLQASPQTEE
jgi:FtsH-binding integral membrane protein